MSDSFTDPRISGCLGINVPLSNFPNCIEKGLSCTSEAYVLPATRSGVLRGGTRSSRRSPVSGAMSAHLLCFRELTRWVWRRDLSLVATPAPMFASPLRRANSSCLWLFQSVSAPEPLGETGYSRKNKQVSYSFVCAPSSISTPAPCPSPHPVPQT